MASDLDIAPGDIVIKPGSKVRLISGGPIMSVESVGTSPDKWNCIWFGDDPDKWQHCIQVQFHACVLELVVER